MPDKKLSIKDWSDDEKPRERLIAQGVHALKDSELLAILISTGSGKESAIDLARNILNANENKLDLFTTVTLEKLTEINGIGPAKATTILAAIEFGRRVSITSPKQGEKLTTYHQFYTLFDHIKHLKHEEFWVACLNAKSELIDKTCIHKGNINKIVVDPRLIFAKALEKKATSIVLAHNHPSGDSNPSKDDIRLTNDLKKIGDLMQIKLADHVIMSSTTNFSFYLHDLI